MSSFKDLKAKRFDFWIAASIVLASSGCAPSAAPLLSQADANLGLAAYTFGPGDKLRINVFNEPNLTGEYAVSTNGTISFPLIGMVNVGGKNIDQVAADLTSKVGAGYMNNPKISVEVLNYRPYYILGEVAKPGEYPYVAGMTVEQAVAAAGGFNYRANQKRINIRRNVNPQERSIKLDSETPVKVMPGDTIRVLERYL